MIDKDVFIRWAEKHWPEVYIGSHGEVQVNSIFVEDTKRHLYCNVEKGVYHCFKSDNGGKLINLVAKVEGCSIAEAERILGRNPIRDLEAKVEQFYATKNKSKEKPLNEIELPPDTYRVTSLPKESRARVIAEKYLISRKMPLDDFFFCINGKYKDRIIIPYFGPDGQLIYWNSRDVTGKSEVRYLGPDVATTKVGKKNVLWIKKWPKPGEKLYLTEGEFDAMSLCQAELLAGACGGKMLHDDQINLLDGRDYERLTSYQICLAFDNDKSGKEALNKIGKYLNGNGIQKVSYVIPPEGYKDWNKMLVEDGRALIHHYIHFSERLFTQDTPLLLGLNRLG